MLRSSESQKDSEESERIGNIEYLEPEFQEAIDKMLTSHDLAKSQMRNAAKDRLEKMQQKFDVASRVSFSNFEDPEATRFILKSMFETINETIKESDKYSKQVMRQNLDVAFQSISGLSKRIRSSFREQHQAKPVESSRKEVDANMKLYMRMIVLVLIYVFFAVFSEYVNKGYTNKYQQPPTFYQSALLMGITFVLFYLKQFQ